MRKRARLLVLVLLFSCLLFFAENVYSSKSLALRVLSQAVLVLPPLAWLGWLVWKRKGIPSTWLDGPLLVWLGAAAVAALAGLSPRHSLDAVWIYPVYILGFWLLVDTKGMAWEKPVLAALFLTAGIVCLVALAEWFSWYLGLPFLPGVVVGWPELGGWADPVPPWIYRLNMTLGGATPLSAYVALMIPPSLAWTLTARSRQGRLAGGLLLCGLLAAEFLAFSRGALLALAVSLAITAGAWLAAAPETWQSVLRWVRRRRAAATAALLGALVLVGVVGGTWTLESFVGRGFSTRFRLSLWQVALDTFTANPWTGVGPGNFGRALLARNDSALPRVQIATAHSLYLNTAAEMGLLGLLAGGLLLMAAVRAGLERWRGSDSRTERLRIAACGGALAGLAAQQLVDTFPGPAHVVPALVLAAFAVAPARPAAARRGHCRWPVVGIAVLLALVVWLVWMDVAHYHLEQSVSLAGAGDFEAASGEAGVAREMDRHLALHTFQLAYTEGLWSAGDGGVGVAASAISHYQEGLALDPIWGTNTANLAGLLWEQGDVDRALEWMRLTVEADHGALHLLNLGLLYEQSGRTDDAWKSYAETLLASPSLAGSGFWTAEATRSAAWPEILQRIDDGLEGSPDQGQASFWAMFAWARGEVELAEQQARLLVSLAPDSADGYVWLTRALLAQGRVAEAMGAAEIAVSLEPVRSDTHSALGCAHLGAGDAAQAEDELQLALFMPAGAREEAYACLAELNRDRGDREAAIWAYERAVAPRAISQDVEITLYGRLAGFDLLPGLVRIRMGEQEAGPWLRLGDLYEQEQSWDDARRVYLALLAEDPYLRAAENRLEALPRVN